MSGGHLKAKPTSPCVSRSDASHQMPFSAGVPESSLSSFTTYWSTLVQTPSSQPWDVTPYVVVALTVAQLCLSLCDRMHCSPPGSPVHGILQAGILEWVAMPFCIPHGRQPSSPHLYSDISSRSFSAGCPSPCGMRTPLGSLCLSCQNHYWPWALFL